MQLPLFSMEKIVHTITGTHKIKSDYFNPCPENDLDLVLKQHRDVLITRLIRGFDLYITYRFNVRPNSKQLSTVKERLYSLKNSGIDRKLYNVFYQDLRNRDFFKVSSKPFYIEIESIIQGGLVNYLTSEGGN
jgi:hypothetical protein